MCLQCQKISVFKFSVASLGLNAILNFSLKHSLHVLFTGLNDGMFLSKIFHSTFGSFPPSFSFFVYSYVCSFIRLFVCLLSLCSFVCLFVTKSVQSFVGSSFSPFFCLFVRPFACKFVPPFVRLFVGPFVYSSSRSFTENQRTFQ